MLLTEVFLDTFGRLRKQWIVPEVFHPAVRLPSDAALAEAHDQWQNDLDADLVQFCQSKRVFLSINRFERKKVVICPQ